MTKKHGIEILRPKNRNIEIRVGTKYPRHRETEKTKWFHRDSIVIPRHFFSGQKATTSRFQGWKTQHRDSKTKKSQHRVSAEFWTLYPPPSLIANFHWRNFITKKAEESVPDNEMVKKSCAGAYTSL